MFLKNKSARPITLNDEKNAYQIKCGDNPAVEVPDAMAKNEFVKSLLDSGDLVKVDAPKSDKKKGE